MQIPLLDLAAQYRPIREEIRSAIDEVCETQSFILGEAVEKLEQDIAAYCDCDAACGVSSGSDALLVSLMAEGIGHGDEVITTPYTFFATVGAISRVGAKPVFVDIDKETYNIRADLIESKINERTKALIIVHLFGHAADMDPIMDVARRHNLVVIEDAAQSIGSEYKARRLGSIGDYGCFSFFPSKNLGCFGDGGIVVTNDSSRHKRLVNLRNHGSSTKYYHENIGGNFRLDALQAKILSVKLKYLDSWTSGRQRVAGEYVRLLTEQGLEKDVITPTCAAYCNRHVYNQFCLRITAGRRDDVISGLNAAGIGSNIYYPLPLHLQECYADLEYKKGDFPESEKLAAEALAIPVYPELDGEQCEYIVDTISKCLAC